MMSIEEALKQGTYDNKLPYLSRKANTNANDAYHTENARIRSQFARDIAFEYSLENHPKAAVLFELAWEEGHSSGYSEIAYYYERFSVLLK